MADQLDTVVRELDLPHFRVPAPRNSALHNSALHNSALHDSAATADNAAHDTTVHLDKPSAAARVSPHTKVFSRDELPLPADDDTEDFDDENPSYTGKFAGIDLNEFYWARQRARRVLFF
jgi:serine/threonine-protein kinase